MGAHVLKDPTTLLPEIRPIQLSFSLKSYAGIKISSSAPAPKFPAKKFTQFYEKIQYSANISVITIEQKQAEAPIQLRNAVVNGNDQTEEFS